jgi:hypothetical protein
MKARQQAGLGQALDIPANGLQGDRKGFGQKLNGGGTLGLHQGQQLGLSGIGIHGWRFGGSGNHKPSSNGTNLGKIPNQLKQNRTKMRKEKKISRMPKLVGSTSCSSP